MIYFDNAATYKINCNDLNKHFIEIQNEYFANPSSSHRLGYLVNNEIDKVRKNILNLLNLDDSYEVIFTSGATEAINFAIKGYARMNVNRGRKIISFVNEHPAVINSLEVLKKEGFEILYISSNENGEIDYNELNNKIDNQTILVSVMAINNEVGSVNNLNKIHEIVSKFPKCVLFSDVTQGIGKDKIYFTNLDMFAFSSHKFGGYIGCGALIKKKKIRLTKLIDGGHQENNLRSGTMSLPLASSTYFALKKAMDNISINYKKVSLLKTSLVEKIKNIDGILLNSTMEFPYIVNFSFLNHKASVVLEALSNEEIYVSSLSACNEKINRVSNVLLNMGRDRNLASNSIRVSFSSENTLEEIDIFINKLKEILGKIR